METKIEDLKKCGNKFVGKVYYNREKCQFSQLRIHKDEITHIHENIIASSKYYQDAKTSLMIEVVSDEYIANNLYKLQFVKIAIHDYIGWRTMTFHERNPQFARANQIGKSIGLNEIALDYDNLLFY